MLAILFTATLPVAACSSDGESSCAALRRDLHELSANTQSTMQAWNDIDELQQAISEVERLRSRIASECDG